MKSETPESESALPEKTLVEGEDFYIESGLMVLTAKYLLDRGYCCKNGCRHCPYGFKASDQSR